ncbi:MAG: peptide chain release factor N(5)-glutamine methyltransferase [Acidobacteriota bacterium]
MPNIAETIQKATKILLQNGIAEPRREANSLLAFALNKDKTFLIAHPEYDLTENEQKHFDEMMNRRANREPFQHITGKQEFYGLDFEVNSNVLIPRPETELIVEHAIQILVKIESPKFCEIGTGSGCISVSILHNVEKATAIGLDISEKAIEITNINSKKHYVSERLKLKQSDVFAVLTDEIFDLIVSNPPYIPNEDIPNLQNEVRDFEPINALTDGKDGLSIIENIVKNSPKFLCQKGFLLM